MWNQPPVDPHNLFLNKNPLDLEFIQLHQNKNHGLMKALKEDKAFIQLSVGYVSLVHYDNNKTDIPKIVIPHIIQYSMLYDGYTACLVMRVYHDFLSHWEDTSGSLTWSKQ